MADHHDNSYKLLFSHPEMVRDLLTGFVREDWVRELDFSTLEKVNGSYVTDELRDREDDIVWRVRWGGGAVPAGAQPQRAGPAGSAGPSGGVAPVPGADWVAALVRGVDAPGDAPASSTGDGTAAVQRPSGLARGTRHAGRTDQALARPVDRGRAPGRTSGSSRESPAHTDHPEVRRAARLGGSTTRFGH
ncbi:hypothetical protein B1A74_07100 [Thioalkalivibrio halophilus]|uniref:Transposase (putative) YhgA-like domain-containing protein n=1 Tax=Thioalkalivibrio halophilus TaxID=252474 RepID=A0A1V2ZZB4_9GAMM|nr:hypothetical protein B1A74_07100 [Thioalkalivibrio halophilus]